MRLTEEQMIQSRIETAVSEALKEQMERVRGIVIDSFYGHRNYAREAPEGVNWKEFLFSTLDHMENELVANLKSQLESE